MDETEPRFEINYGVRAVHKSSKEAVRENIKPIILKKSSKELEYCEQLSDFVW